MTDETNPSILEIAERALQIDENARDDWLREHCPPERLAEVQRLIDQSQSLETEALLDSHAPAPGADYTGERIGAYRVVKPIGQGGMGQVYLAARSDGGFEQEVAIKLILSSGLNDLAVKQFADERQILAQLRHPNIALLLDGGATERGVPYVVMEYIEGLDLADYLKTQRPSLPDRLRIFQAICSAVAYAHRNLVIHRDIKPANVRVAADGTPKLLDFGIAKSIEDSVDRTHTVSAALTPASASPEQVKGETLTTASDVYSLGALLYFLLCQRMPLTATNQADWVEAVTQEIPKNPSIYDAGVPRDLDLIALKALEKDPDRRYATADALMEDVERFLSGEPVSARAASLIYRARRFVQRNTAAVIASSLFVAALFVGVVVSTLQTVRAEAAQKHSEETAKFLQSMFIAISPYSGTALGMDATVGEMLELAADNIDLQFDSEPARQVELYGDMAVIYLANNSFANAQAMLDRVSEIEANEGLGEIAGESTRLLVQAGLHAARGDIESSHGICRRIETTVWDSDDREDDIAFVSYCGMASLIKGDEEEGVRIFERGRALALAADSNFTPLQRATILSAIANGYMRLKGHHMTAPVLLDEAINFAKEGGNLAVLADLYRMRSMPPNQVGDADESLRYTTLAVETAEASRLRKDGTTMAFIRLYHADRLIDVDRLGEAEDVLTPVRVVISDATSEASAGRAVLHFTDYKLAFKLRDFDRAEEALLACKQIYLDMGDTQSAWIAQSNHGLGKVYVEQGRYDEAVQILTLGYEYYLDLYGADHERVISHKKELDKAIRLRDSSKPDTAMQKLKVSESQAAR